MLTRRSIGIVLGLICFALMTSVPFATLAAPAPVKIVIDSSKKTPGVGDTVDLTVKLLDAANQPAVAFDRMEIVVEVGKLGGRLEKRNVVIEPGQSSAKLEYQVGSAGIIELRAQHPEVLQGGKLLKAADPPRLQSSSRLEMRAPMVEGSAPEMAGSDPSAQRPVVFLHTLPSRGVLADSKDVATVSAVLKEPAVAESDMIIRLLNDEGELIPIPLTIPAGEGLGSAQLTSDRPGIVRVSYVSAQPTADLDGESRVEVQFVPPITGLELTGSPPKVSLLESTQLVVKFIDENGDALATDSERQVSLTLSEGRGQISPTRITVPTGQFEGRAKLTPSWWGEFRVTASSPSLQSKSTLIMVEIPVLLLLLTAIGGLAGGYLDAPKAREGLARRLVTGLVTGLVLYWAFAFNVVDKLPQVAVLNPLSALVIAVLGGWMGTKVLNLLLRLLGLVGGPASGSGPDGND